MFASIRYHFVSFEQFHIVVDCAQTHRTHDKSPNPVYALHVHCFTDFSFLSWTRARPCQCVWARWVRSYVFVIRSWVCVYGFVTSVRRVATFFSVRFFFVFSRGKMCCVFSTLSLAVRRMRIHWYWAKIAERRRSQFAVLKLISLSTMTTQWHRIDQRIARKMST